MSSFCNVHDQELNKTFADLGKNKIGLALDRWECNSESNNLDTT